jgi:hypothetical protein
LKPHLPSDLSLAPRSSSDESREKIKALNRREFRPRKKGDERRKKREKKKGKKGEEELGFSSSFFSFPIRF